MSTRTRMAALAAAVALPLTLASCAGIRVRTITAPEAGLEALHTFQMLPGPARRDGRALTGADDPMINNSIANRAIRERITQAFKNLGYERVDARPDFVVAFYATAREKLDVTTWDYGYSLPIWWPRSPVPAPTITPYTEGTVVVDVVQGRSRLLLWRGEGRASLSNDAQQNVEQLAAAAAAIVMKFPVAPSRVIATHQ